MDALEKLLERRKILNLCTSNVTETQRLLRKLREPQPNPEFAAIESFADMLVLIATTNSMIASLIVTLDERTNEPKVK